MGDAPPAGRHGDSPFPTPPGSAGDWIAIAPIGLSLTAPSFDATVAVVWIGGKCGFAFVIDFQTTASPVSLHTNR